MSETLPLLPPPLYLYVHLPWCVRKCPYCDFNSHVHRHGAIPDRDYVDALLRDLELALPDVWGRTLCGVFIGGGTPSLFSPETIDRLLQGVRARLRCLPDMEITLEANPGTVEQTRFEDFRQAGVNRLSIGVQSFDPTQLEALGRIHGRQEAIAAAEAAHAAGFDNFNLDLMFALPGQTPAAAETDVALACKLAPAHISYYQLTLEPDTPFFHRPPPLPDDDAAWTIQSAGQRMLARHGYRQYEISAYARDGRQCRHNLNYWCFGDYLGIGAGAHGKLSFPDGRIVRSARQRHPQRYMACAGTRQGIAETRLVSREERPFEFAMNALRLREGFEMAIYRERTGLTDATLAPTLDRAAERGLIERESGRVCASPLGWRHLNDLLMLFLPETDSAATETTPP